MKKLPMASLMRGHRMAKLLHLLLEVIELASSPGHRRWRT
jgi:hypothetical protein